MYIIGTMILVAIVVILILSGTKPGKQIAGFFTFFAEGKDKGFTTGNLMLLWRTATFVGLKEKPKLFWSVPALNECIAFISRQVENPVNEESRSKMQLMLNKLYDYRTKVELEKSEKKRALDSTRGIFQNQICIILVPNEATVYAKVISNTKQNLQLALYDASFNRAKGVSWKNKFIRVYFWKRDDAGYIFPSTVIAHSFYADRLEISIKHSNKLTRTQKRKSVRASCEFNALMFPILSSMPYSSKYETEGGVKCIVKDISEDGAMLFVRGKAVKGLKMKLQFKIKNTPIVMCGKVVRFVYENTSNKSRVHFQCESLDQKSRNTILSFVYDITSDENTEFISTLFDEDETTKINNETEQGT